jgi:hypothetical protein
MYVVFVAAVGVIVVLGMPLHLALPALVGIGALAAWLGMSSKATPAAHEMQLALLRTKTVLSELEAGQTAAAPARP